ncbi:xanthine dehydrogenase family protein molybdopterin-binding subunit [Flavisphingomonas formosensis]|uniref:xanthine dehydrogenase family protein molybdopterin-binding subunit n=1 Tax=Flavisphingomonas formosensis TaxID=861534 RepID=UPI0012F75991|nr:molybdopterin cofactor-binding domain-containing protein [Sphingomonas formosensis]
MAGLGERGVSRRTLLIGGGAGVGLLVAWGLWPRSYAPNVAAAPGENLFNAFLKIGTDGHVSVVVPQAEMGQGVWTSLPQILAEELGADWRTIAVEPAPISPLYANDFLIAESARQALPSLLQDAGAWVARQVAIRSALMITGGSSSIRGFEQRFREAGAAGRALLCMAAAKRLDVDWQACDTEAGFVVRGNDRLRFGELAAEAAGFTPPAMLPLRAIGTAQISGQSVPRLDLPAKVDGSARFTADVRLPGMVYASAMMGPAGDATLDAIDETAARRRPGFVGVVREPRWVAAVGQTWWAADQALKALKPRFTIHGPVTDSASIDKALKTALDAGEATTMAARGDLAAAFGGQGVLGADYAVPLAVHAPMEPLTATARLTGDRLEIWAPTQAPGLARAAAAKAIGIAEAQVTVYPMLIGGGFGRKVEVEAIGQAAVIAKRIGRPVQLLWSRAEETMQDRFRPPAIGRMQAKLGPGGRLLGWRARIAAPVTMGGMMRRIAPGIPSPGHGAEPSAVEGAVPPYDIGALAVEHVPVDIGIGTGIWRSVANSYTAFFTECFVDELAHRAGIEPLSFRMQMLNGNVRLARCLTTVTALGGWNGGELGGGQGLAAHSCFGSHVAMMAEVHVDEGRQLVVDAITAVVDCGRMINPEIVRQQVEGGILWGLAATLGGTSGITRGRPDARNFDALDLPILANTPEIAIEIVHSREHPGGVGEIAVPPVAPAIANALFSATGQRVRQLPLRIGAAA